MNGTMYPTTTPAALCTICGIALDAEPFDESGIAEAPRPGQSVLLARFELSPQYCGVLQYFSQFTDLYARDNSQIETPGLEWTIFLNKRPLYPYVGFNRIVNPWGYGSFQIAIRLDENAKLEFMVRNIGGGSSAAGGAVRRVGGRIMGRYWYNVVYGDVVRRGS